MIDLWYDIKKYSSPLLAIAVHDGHHVRHDVAECLLIDEYKRLQEEDPYTGFFTKIAASRMIINTSRFEVDVNRPREQAIYRTPEQAWGLDVWKDEVPEEVWKKNLEEYDKFYYLFERIISEIIEIWGYILIYDIHSYNYRREGEPGENDNLINPEINVGTATMNRKLWAPVVEYFMQQMGRYNYMGRHLYIRENLRFKGGYLSEWVHRRFSNQSCVMAIELKKFYMDENTGAVDIPRLKSLKEALFETVPGVIQRAQIIQKERMRTVNVSSLKERNKTKFRIRKK